MKIVNLLLLLCLCLAFAACKKNTQPPRQQLTLNLQEGDPPSLNPYVGVDLRSRCLFLNLFEPLMRRSADGLLKPAAAETVDIDETRTIYTFHLRHLLWSNGEAVTSQHFAQAWKYALTPGSNCFRADLFYPIKNAEKVKKGELPVQALGIDAPDPQTLIVSLEHPTPYFLDLTATSFFSPLYSVSQEDPTCFNGPFIVKTRVWDQKLIFEKNPYYWDADSIELDEICFTMVRDPMTALAMYEKNEIDLVGDPFSPLPFDVVPDLEKTGELKIKPIARILYLLVNTDSFPLNSKSLRKALSLSIDRDDLTSHVFFGEFPTLSALPKPLSLTDQNQFKNKEEQAVAFFEEALKELNLTREAFPKITFSYAELSGQRKLAEFIQEQWQKKLGIEINIECTEWNVHISKLRSGNYQLGTLHLTTLYQDPMFYFDLFKDKSAVCNYCKWENEEFRRLLTSSENMCDLAQRKHCLSQAEALLFEEMPVIPLFTQNLQYLMRDNIHLEITDLGIYDFKSFHLARSPI